MHWLRKSPVQTFLLVPLATIAWEWALGALHVQPPFLLLMLWGFLQYRFCGRYRVALTFQSMFAAAIVIARTVWFHYRVLRDERGLTERFGEPYVAYTRRVKRWLP